MEGGQREALTESSKPEQKRTANGGPRIIHFQFMDMSTELLKYISIMHITTSTFLIHSENSLEEKNDVEEEFCNSALVTVAGAVRAAVVMDSCTKLISCKMLINITPLCC